MIVKATYTRIRSRAKANIRYITHRLDREGERVTRTLFGYDGTLTKAQAYRMIDEAGVGTVFFRMVISPAPKREDRYRDLNLAEITIHTMLKLEERLGKQIQFLATIHDDHSPHRHVHALVLVQGARLTREDFQALREEAQELALFQRRVRDLTRNHSVRLKQSRNSSLKRFALRGIRPYQSYTCPLGHYHQTLPSSRLGYRCPVCGLYLRRDRQKELYSLQRLIQRKGVGLELSLSP